MLVEMLTSVATNFGAYNEGQKYDLAEPLATVFVRHGWAVARAEQAPAVETAMLPRAESSTQQRQGRGKPYAAR